MREIGDSAAEHGDLVFCIERSPPPMRIHVVGAGAIAGMAGAFMAMNGEDVTVIDRWEEHVRAIRERGLLIDGVRGRHVVPLRALMPEEVDEPIDLVFVGVKSQHTEEALRSVMPHLTAQATIVSLQNGFNAERIGKLVGVERVLGTVPDYTAALVDPGRLEFTVGGPVYVGELDGSLTDRGREVQRLLSTVTAAQLTTNIVGRIWTKQCYMSQIVMTALVAAPITDVMRSDRNKLLGVAVVRETLPVADAAGVRLESDRFFRPDLIRQRSPEARRAQVEVLRGLSDHFQRKAADEDARPGYRFVKQGSGMWWDIVYRRRPSETRWITGAVIDRARVHAIPMPLNTAMVQMIYEIEGGRRSLGWDNLETLAEIAVAQGEPLTLDA
jgi:2-dehydropantoate 2-reductase